jgi:hypothetical protein
MSFRVTPGFKATLDQAANESGRSLAQEIELRLERSLDEGRRLSDILEIIFGRQAAGLLLAIGLLINDLAPVRRPGDIGWLSDPEAFRVILESIELLLQAIDPNAHPTAWAVLRRSIHDADQGNAALVASVLAMAIADHELEDGIDDWSPALLQTIRSGLGESVSARLRDRLGLLKEATISEEGE